MNATQKEDGHANPYSTEFKKPQSKRGNWYRFRAATLNILSGKEDAYIELAAREMVKYSITILALQEVRRVTDDRIVEIVVNLRKYSFRLITSGNDTRNHGVGILIRDTVGIKIQNISCISGRILKINASLNGYDTIILSAYAPTATSENETIDEFYDSLENAMKTGHKTQKLLLLGDFNAYPTFANNHSCVSEKYDFCEEDNANYNTESLIKLICTSKLSVLNT